MFIQSWIFKSFQWCAKSPCAEFQPITARGDLAHHWNDLKIQLWYYFDDFYFNIHGKLSAVWSFTNFSVWLELVKIQRTSKGFKAILKSLFYVIELSFYTQLKVNNPLGAPGSAPATRPRQQLFRSGGRGDIAKTTYTGV